MKRAGAILFAAVIAAITLSARAEENLIVNPGFEKNKVGVRPDDWHCERFPSKEKTGFLFETAKGGYESAQCGRIVLSGAVNAGCMDQQPDVPNKPSVGLALSAWLRSDSPGGSVRLAIHLKAKNRPAAGNVAMAHRDVMVTDEWRKHQVTLSLGDAGKVQPGDQLRARCIIQLHAEHKSMRVDDVSLTVIGAQEVYDAFKSEVPAQYRKDLLDAGGHASFILMKDGRPAIFYRRNAPVFRISDDQGLTWGLPKAIDLGVDVCSKRMIQPVRLKSGALGLVTVGKDRKLYFTKSLDEGKTWGETVAINPNGPICWPLHDSAFVTSKGRIVVPGWITFKGDDHDNKNWSGPVDVETYCWLSDDEGKTWFKGGNVVTEHEGRKLPFEETVGVELKDGRLMLLGRTPMARIFKSTSSDGGETWTSPEPTPLVSSYAPCALARMSNGDLVCVFNQASVEEVRQNYRRQRLTAAVSSDDGETWKHHRNLESLDDRHRIDQPVNWDVFSMHHEQLYQQPTDKELYPHAPGPLCVTYPSIGATPDRVIVAHSYSCLPGGIRGPFLKVRSLPIQWFYENP